MKRLEEDCLDYGEWRRKKMLVERERVGYEVTLKVILGIFENFKSIF